MALFIRLRDGIGMAWHGLAWQGALKALAVNLRRVAEIRYDSPQ
jgi:hypothetical protein